MWPFRKARRDDEPPQPLDPESSDLPAHRGESWERLYDELVPDSGPASTVAGEVLRATTRVSSEYSRNGCMNWGPYYADMCEFSRVQLTDGTFAPRWTSFLERTLSDMATLGDWYARRDGLDEDAPDFEEQLEAMEEAGPGVDVAYEALATAEQLSELWVRAHLEANGGESPAFEAS